MKNHKIKKNYKIVLLAALLIGAIIAIVLSFWNHSVPAPAPVMPTPISFQIISIFPGTGSQTIVIKNTAIAITFSSEVLSNSISVSTIPYISLQTELKSNNPSVVYLKPVSKWQYQQKYAIRVSATSINGQILENYQFEFQPQPPKGSNIDYGPYGI